MTPGFRLRNKPCAFPPAVAHLVLVREPDDAPYLQFYMPLIFPASLWRRLTIFSFLAVMSFFGGRAAARSPISLDVLQRDGYGSVGLVKEGQNRLYVLAEINGHKVKLLLDTGWAPKALPLE